MTKEELESQEANLFAEWKLHQETTLRSSGFVKDGIVDYDVWTTTEPKILFLLKEPNCDGDAEAWDNDLLPGLRAGGRNVEKEHPRPGAIWRNWQVIARWAYHLTGRDEVRWDSIDDEANISFRSENLRKVAVVNLKKNGGYAVCDENKLAEYVRVCGQFARRQIELYKPDLIICGYTYGLLKEHLFPDSERLPDRRTTRGERWCRLKAWPCAVVDFYHFGYRIPANMFHFMLVDACREIMSTPQLT